MITICSSTKHAISFRELLICETAILLYLALLKLAIHLVTGNSYGYFADELYYLAMVQHLDFGYVDVPPIVPLLMAMSNMLLGTSLFALHVFPAIAGAAMVFCAGLIAREMGGGRLAQALTAVAVITAPIWMVLDSWFAYDPFDQLITVILFLAAAALIKRETPRRWIVIGIIAGLGLMIKLAMLFTCFGFAIALLLTHHRKSLLTRWPWIAAGLAVCICMPYIVWQIMHGIPLMSYWSHYAQHRPHQDILHFFGGLVFMLNPLALPVILAGLYYLFFNSDGKRFRLLGMIFLVLVVFYNVVMHTEFRMLVSACFPLLAAGAVLIENKLARLKHKWPAFAYVAVLCVSGIVLAPAFLPILPKERLVNSLHLKSSDDIPVHFSLRFGWKEMVEHIAAIYHSLPEEERDKCVIYAGLYEQAAAIDFFGGEYGLPKVICNHLSYQTWGPGDRPGEVVIAFGKRFSENDAAGTIPLSKLFAEVSRVGTITGLKESVIYEQNLPVFVCRKPFWKLKDVWNLLEFYY